MLLFGAIDEDEISNNNYDDYIDSNIYGYADDDLITQSSQLFNDFIGINEDTSNTLLDDIAKSNNDNNEPLHDSWWSSSPLPQSFIVAQYQQQPQRYLQAGGLQDSPIPTTTTATKHNEDNNPSVILASVLSQVLLFSLIFGLSATVDMKNMSKQIKNKFALITGICMQFVVMPLLGFLSVLLLSHYGLSHSMGITLLVVTASPGGSYSNWWCNTFNADLALSVAMTAVSTILSVGLLPANLFLYTWLAYGKDDESNVVSAVDWGSLFISLGIVIAAIVGGLFASYKVKSIAFNIWANRLGSISGLLLIAFSIVIGSGTGEAETNFWSQPGAFYGGVAFPCVIGLFIANIIARSFNLAKPETCAISVECCYQNVGIATSVAISMFNDPTERAEAISVPLFYGLVEALVIFIYLLVAWKVGWTKAPSNENCCTVISKSYEIEYNIEGDNEGENSDTDETFHSATCAPAPTCCGIGGRNNNNNAASLKQHPDEEIAAIEEGNVLRHNPIINKSCSRNKLLSEDDETTVTTKSTSKTDETFKENDRFDNSGSICINNSNIVAANSNSNRNRLTSDVSDLTTDMIPLPTSGGGPSGYQRCRIESYDSIECIEMIGMMSDGSSASDDTDNINDNNNNNATTVTTNTTTTTPANISSSINTASRNYKNNDDAIKEEEEQEDCDSEIFHDCEEQEAGLKDDNKY